MIKVTYLFQSMENGVTGVIMRHVQKHVEVHHKSEQENVITQHQLTVEFHVQDLMKIRKLAELLHAQVYIHLFTLRVTARAAGEKIFIFKDLLKSY